MEAIRAVLFDLDDTLVDSNSAFRAVAKQLNDSQPALQKEHSREEVLAMLVRWDSFEYRFGRILEAWPVIEMSVSELRASYYQRCARL